MTDGIDVATVFRERMTELLRAEDWSQSAFAREVGVDRSTLAQLMAARSPRLPRVDTLIAISQATGVSVDWLLGLSREGPVRSDIVHEEFALRLNELSPLDERFIAWYEEAVGAKIRSVPGSLPALLKTEAVIRHEVQRYATIRPEQRIETEVAQLEMARAPGSDLECCNSIQAVEGFARGEEIWAALDRRERIAQLDRMIELTEELYPTFRWFLYDARERYATAITIFGLQRAVVYLGQMYLVLTGQQHVLTFVAHFDDLIRAARVQPPEVPKVLKRLRSELAA